MTRKVRSVDELSVEELRQLLVEKRRSERQTRLEQYRKTGRIITVEPVPAAPGLDALQSTPLTEKAAAEKAERPHAVRRRKGVETMLVVLEVGAVIGLIFILFSIASLLRSINSPDTASIVVNLTPTALISEIVLPSGHTPPDSPGGAQYNYNEIPEHLRAVVQLNAEMPIPTPAPENAQNIRIPKIGVNQTIFQGDGWEQLKKGVGQHLGSGDPGQPGNLVLSAHNDIYGETFRHLDQLEKGDEIHIRTSIREYTYIVESIEIVPPTRVDVMAPTTDPVVTLISCYPYRVDDQRIVVTASLLQ